MNLRERFQNCVLSIQIGHLKMFESIEKRRA